MQSMGVARESQRAVTPVEGQPAAGLFIRGGKGSFWLNAGMRLAGLLSILVVVGLFYGGYRLVMHFVGDPSPADGVAVVDSTMAPAAVVQWCWPDREKLLWGPALSAFTRPGTWPSGLRVAREADGDGVTRRTYQIGETEIEIQQVTTPGDPRGLLKIRPAIGMTPCEIMQATGWMGIDSVGWVPGQLGLRPPNGLRMTSRWDANGAITELRVLRTP